MTDACALMNVRRLFRQVHAPNLPDPTTLPEIAADWLSLLPDVTDDALNHAVALWLRDPERGRFWPSISDLTARVPGLATLTPMDPDEHAWELILACVRRGDEASQTTVTFEDVVDAKGVRRVRPVRIPSGLELQLGPARFAVLQAIGGRLAFRRLHGTPDEVGKGMGSLRKRFLTLCRAGAESPVHALDAPLAHVELPDNVRAFIGRDDDPHAATRAAAVARERAR